MNFSVLNQFRAATQFLLASKTCTGTLELSKAAPALSSISSFQVLKRWKSDDRRMLIKSTPRKDMGTQGEQQLDVDLVNVSTQANVYPDEDTPDLLFDGIKFKDLPICSIKATKNNTLMHVTDSDGQTTYAYHSCGLEGFRNTRKGTNIAAQTAAVTLSGMIKKKGITNVRVKVQGLGPGRMSSIKGLQMSGVNVVSITDFTPISFNPPRPRKARRL